MRNGLMNSVMTCTNTPWSENEVTCEHYGKFEANVDTLMTVLNFILIVSFFKTERKPKESFISGDSLMTFGSESSKYIPSVLTIFEIFNAESYALKYV